MTFPSRTAFLLIPGFAFILSCFVIIDVVHAETIEGLYESRQKINTAKQHELPQSQLIRNAFTHVLIKVSGQQQITRLPEYEGMLSEAENAVQLFRYETGEQQGTEEKWFWVRFNENTINKLLSKNFLPVWGKVRPSTLIWFSREIDNQRILQSQYEAPEAYTAMEKQADYRGIELVFPFMDLQDQSQLEAADIWGNFNEPVLAASKRYQSQSTLTLGLFQERSGLWVALWNFMILGETYQWKTQAEQQDKALTSGIDLLADHLAKEFAVVNKDRNNDAILIQINNLAGYGNYQQLVDYFATLASVKSVSLILLEHDRAVYKVFYQGNKTALQREINSGDVLQPVEATRTFVREPDAGSDYKAVILDDAAKKPLNSTQAEAMREETLIEKPVQLPVPELEYWLVR